MILLQHLFDIDLIHHLKESMMSYLCTYQRKSKITLAQACLDNSTKMPNWNKTFVPIMSVNAEKRFEFITPFEKPFSHVEVFANPILLEILNNVLSPEYILESIGGFNAMPGATDQIWHIDNEHTLFNNFPKHPPYCSTFSAPLVPCNKTTGCTEFSFRSHHCLDASHTGERIDGKCPETVNVWPQAMPGDAIIYDPRIMHRGRANVGGIDRPMLHNSYCHSWYRDQDNERAEGIYNSNLNRLGKIPKHVQQNLNENANVVEKLYVGSLVHQMYTLYSMPSNDSKEGKEPEGGMPLPVIEAVQGTSSSVEIHRNRIEEHLEEQLKQQHY
jgi:ectoine hydroxylase-related dioxygenase (phytanoyl-CoA dioxygenase family)